ncbi:MSMEG_0567/Sll0786 family nitrogen starvation N-acetyltransferase [Burkholderia sp. 22PA0099]|uniref:MSMEG_0567/Sll0786 family nitrogen starvation N-acetyltransferase n=1 Tax=unclassified Burkholderia TaxID=2613784 RepID=UPI0039C1C6C9
MDCEAMWDSGAALAYRPAEFRIKWAALPWEVQEAYRLRRAVFCVEQGVFVGDDRDEIDAHAQPLVAVSGCAGLPDQVVGTVRIHETAPGVWLGSRLAVHAAFRTHGRIGSTLILLAVRSAHALGCREFHAHVQAQNVPLFRRLHWESLGEEMLHGRLHHRMLADLAHYPPCTTPYTGFVLPAGGGR